jgi:hypothetical protein
MALSFPCRAEPARAATVQAANPANTENSLRVTLCIGDSFRNGPGWHAPAFREKILAHRQARRNRFALIFQETEKREEKPEPDPVRMRARKTPLREAEILLQALFRPPFTALFRPPCSS